MDKQRTSLAPQAEVPTALPPPSSERLIKVRSFRRRAQLYGALLRLIPAIRGQQGKSSPDLDNKNSAGSPKMNSPDPCGLLEDIFLFDGADLHTKWGLLTSRYKNQVRAWIKYASIMAAFRKASGWDRDLKTWSTTLEKLDGDQKTKHEIHRQDAIEAFAMWNEINPACDFTAETLVQDLPRVLRDITEGARATTTFEISDLNKISREMLEWLSQR